MSRRYRPCRRFMDGGGIYGRCIYYPWRAYRTRHIFSTCIHLNFKHPDFGARSANSRAFNARPMHVLFAYEWRQRLGFEPQPPTKKTFVPEVFESHEWKEAA